jgi:acetylornithine deacetylase/succinyl-diaminopimelate desuccinylase-like protein
MIRVADSEVDQAELVSLTQQLVRIPSPQTELMEAEPAVQQFIAVCAEILADRGLRGRRDRMGNLLIEIGPSSADKALIIMAYAMNHPPSAMADPFSGDLVDRAGRTAIRGRGVAEQKGALAAAIIAVEQAHRKGELAGRLVFALSSAGETGRHDAATSILDTLGYTPTLGIVALGTNNCVTLGNKGRLDVEIAVYGQAAHSSTPWAGINAIDGARKVLDRLEAWPLGGRDHPMLGKATLTCTRINSFPAATHTIQNEVRLIFDRRLLPRQDPQQAFDEITAALDEIVGTWRIEAKRGPFMYPCEISGEGKLFRAVSTARAAMGLPPPEPLYSHGALDAGFLVARGCEAAMWGPGRMELFHSDEEYLLVEELALGAEDYLALIQSYLGR